jgi:hypothetical protein
MLAWLERLGFAVVASLTLGEVCAVLELFFGEWQREEADTKLGVKNGLSLSPAVESMEDATDISSSGCMAEGLCFAFSLTADMPL